MVNYLQIFRFRDASSSQGARFGPSGIALVTAYDEMVFSNHRRVLRLTGYEVSIVGIDNGHETVPVGALQ